MIPRVPEEEKNFFFKLFLLNTINFGSESFIYLISWRNDIIYAPFLFEKQSRNLSKNQPCVTIFSPWDSFTLK